MKKTLYYFLGLVLGVLTLIVLQAPGERMRIVACEVGQGDAILIIKGSIQVLVDGGPSGEKVLSCLERQLPFWDRTIELIVLTHTDYDHMNGLSAVVDRYRVIQFVTADGVHESQALWKLRDSIVRNGVVAKMVEQGDEVRVGEMDGDEVIRMKVVWPPQVERQYLAMFSGEFGESESKQILGASAKKIDTNERSVVLLIEEGDYRALLTGDSGVQAEKEWIKKGLVGKVDYLKLGHHGSKTSSSLEFLEAVEPQLAVISVGEKNRYGHPSEEVMSRLEELGIRYLRTDEIGDVVVVVE